jgi:hypothetical protein
MRKKEKEMSAASTKAIAQAQIRTLIDDWANAMAGLPQNRRQVGDRA